MILPGCQDTGTAIVIGKKGQYVWTEGNDEEALSRGIFDTYTSRNLRYSQVYISILITLFHIYVAVKSNIYTNLYI